MKIAVIGTGNVGRALGLGWLKSGHQVTFGTRDPHSDKVSKLLSAAGSQATAASLQEAVGPADVVVLALPWIYLANPAQLRQKHRLSIATTLR